MLEFRYPPTCLAAQCYTGGPLFVHQFFPKTNHAVRVRRERIETRRLRLEFFAVREIIQIASAPIFDGIQPASLQVIIEKVPEGCPGELADVRGVIYDNIKSIRSSFISDLG